MSDPDNILPHSDSNQGKDLEAERLMAYLEGRLSPAEQHDVELWLAGEGMESDALEGLSTVQPAETRRIVGSLNQKLNKAMHTGRRKRRPLPSGQHTLVAIAIILMLAALAFVVIRLMK